MGRIRTVKPELFIHEGLFEAEKATSLPLRFSYAGLFTVCDREGRFKWRPRELKLAILPYDDVDFSLVLNELWNYGFVVAYKTDEGEIYGFIPSWSKHQVINNREKASELPPPIKEFLLYPPTREARVINTSVTPLLLAQGEGKGKEGKGKEDICEFSVETPPLCFDDNEIIASTHKSQGLHQNGHESKAPKKSRSFSNSDDPSINEVFEYWKLVMNHPKAKLDSKRRKILHSVLKLYTLEQLKQAIEGCANNKYNMGENPNNKRYDSINLIFRDADHIEQYIQDAPANKNSANTKSAFSQADQIAMRAINA